MSRSNAILARRVRAWGLVAQRPGRADRLLPEAFATRRDAVDCSDVVRDAYTQDDAELVPVRIRIEIIPQ